MIYILGFLIYVAQTTNLALAMSCDCKPEYCKPVGFCKGKFTSFLINSTISFISDILCETLGVIFQLSAHSNLHRFGGTAYSKVFNMVFKASMKAI